VIMMPFGAEKLDMECYRNIVVELRWDWVPDNCSIICSWCISI